MVQSTAPAAKVSQESHRSGEILRRGTRGPVDCILWINRRDLFYWRSYAAETAGIPAALTD